MNGGAILVGLSEVLLVFIPKIEHPQSITQFRPLSLCNVTYKVITKLITNRLKEVLGELIAPTQSSFIPGRQMTDNVIICQELIHSMRRKHGHKGAMVVKLDLAKAYDKLEWPFIQDTLVDAGLPSSLVSVIMSCVTNGYCRLLWNGKVTDPIRSTRVLRRVDPFSPYLFELCMERFSQWIEAQKQARLW